MHIMHIMQERFFIAAGVAMAIGLLVAGGALRAGYLFHGHWHHIAHFATFALFGGVWRLGLPRTPAPYIAAGAVAFGFLQEAYEVVGHRHPFELRDALVDSVGAIVGATCASLLLSRRR